MVTPPRCVSSSANLPHDALHVLNVVEAGPYVCSNLAVVGFSTQEGLCRQVSFRPLSVGNLIHVEGGLWLGLLSLGGWCWWRALSLDRCRCGGWRGCWCSMLAVSRLAEDSEAVRRAYSPRLIHLRNLLLFLHLMGTRYGDALGSHHVNSNMTLMGTNSEDWSDTGSEQCGDS